ncbi:MAG: CDP-glycerol glycerophosphotransferase family protein [Agathobacter sp.]|nr:CDP-glycerol glycerophosphotransferase family protein [Agathobacter sp.]
MKDFIYWLRLKLISYLYFFSPIKRDKIVFINFNGKGYGCNPKYIAEEIIRQNLDYDMVWLVNDMNVDMPEQIRKATFRGKDGLYEIATAKVIVTNVKNDLFLVKKRGQYVIQTWHGSYNIKLVEKEAVDRLSASYIRESKKNSKQTDVFISNSKILSKSYRDAFWCDCEIMECGIPRSDVLFREDKDVINKKVREVLGVSLEDKLVLYAPTFRDDGSIDAYNVPSEKILEALGDEWKILLRLHPNVDVNDVGYVYTDRIINASVYPDMQDIILAADVLITDYSDSIFEFSLLRKPSYIYATDIEAFEAMRGLNPDFYKMPFKVCTTDEELIAELCKYTPEVGRAAADKFMEMIGCTDTGNASKCVVQRIREVIEGNRD